MGKTEIVETEIISTLTKGSAVFLTLMVLAGAVFGSLIFAGSILIGGILALLNFYWLGSILRRVIELRPARSSMYVQIRYLLRISIFAVVLYGLIVAGASITGLLIGLSVLVINIIILAIYFSITLKGG